MGTGGVLLRRARSAVSSRPTGFVWLDEGRLAGSGYPASRRQLVWLRNHGIKSVVTLTEKPLPKRWLDGLGLSVTHVGMKDHQPPSIEELEKATSKISEELNAGRTVLVHCLAGKGRTMCVIAAYMIRSGGMRAVDALKYVRTFKPDAVETKQEDALARFESYIKGLEANHKGQEGTGRQKSDE